MTWTKIGIRINLFRDFRDENSKMKGKPLGIILPWDKHGGQDFRGQDKNFD